MPPLPVCEFMDLRSDRAAAFPAWLYAAGHALLSLPFEDAVSSFLKFAGEAADADRAWIIGYNRETTHFYNTHEWCRPGTASYVEDLQHTPVSMIAWLHERLVRKEAVMVNAIERLPRTARALQAEFVRQKNRSVLSVPLFHEDRIFGILGFDATHAPRRWPPEVARTLFQCGSLIVAAWTRAPEAPSAPVMWSADQRPALIYLHQGGHIRGVPVDHIRAVCAEGDYTRVHLQQGPAALELRPLKAWASLLPRKDFQQVHRSTLVNVRHITTLDRPATGTWRVYLRGLDAALNVSKRFRADLRSRLGF